MNFLLRTALAVSHKFWVAVNSFVSRNVLISSIISFLTHLLFNRVLFNLHKFECFWVIPFGFVSIFRPLWSQKILYIISVFLNLLRIVSCPMTSCIFENFPCAFENNVYFILWGEKFCIYQLNLFEIECCSMPQYPCWFFALLIISIVDNGCEPPLVWVCCYRYL